jgi:ABC transporter substrate binding protein
LPLADATLRLPREAERVLHCQKVWPECSDVRFGGDIEPAARAMGMQIKVLNASTSGEINAAFATFVHERPDALFVSADGFFTTRRVQLVHLATRYAVPASYFTREFPEVGGLMSYGSNQSDNYRQVGIYAGHILKGTKPADLPVVQRVSSNWSSMPRPPGRWASTCRRRFSPAPTR